MPSKQELRLLLLAALIRGSCTKCRIPIVIVRIFIIRGSCTKCRIPIVIVKIYYYYYYYASAVKRNVQPKL